MVGVKGFEPLAFWSRTKRATSLRYTPVVITRGEMLSKTECAVNGKNGTPFFGGGISKAGGEPSAESGVLSSALGPVLNGRKWSVCAHANLHIEERYDPKNERT